MLAALAPHGLSHNSAFFQKIWPWQAQIWVVVGKMEEKKFMFPRFLGSRISLVISKSVYLHFFWVNLWVSLCVVYVKYIYVFCSTKMHSAAILTIRIIFCGLDYLRIHVILMMVQHFLLICMMRMRVGRAERTLRVCPRGQNRQRRWILLIS